MFDKLVKIADAAGVTVDWLATGRGPMRREAAPQAASQGVPGSALKGVLREHHARRLEKIGLLLAGMSEEDAEAILEEAFARAQEAAKRRELEQALQRLTAEVERLKKRV